MQDAGKPQQHDYADYATEMTHIKNYMSYRLAAQA